MDWACACPGGQHDRDALGKLAEHGRHGGRDVPGTERRYDQAIDMLGYRAAEVEAAILSAYWHVPGAEAELEAEP